MGNQGGTLRLTACWAVNINILVRFGAFPIVDPKSQLTPDQAPGGDGERPCSQALH